MNKEDLILENQLTILRVLEYNKDVPQYMMDKTRQQKIKIHEALHTTKTIKQPIDSLGILIENQDEDNE